MSRNIKIKSSGSLGLLTVTIGIVYLWFGMLKFFPGLSPAEGLAQETIGMLTFDILPPSWAIVLLAIWETVLGLLLISGLFKRLAIPLALIHIALTFTPMLFFPDQVFAISPFSLTLLGQYITKNIIIAGGLVIIWKDCRHQHSTGNIPGFNQKARS